MSGEQMNFPESWEETTLLIDKSELLKVLIDQVIEVIRDFPTEKEKRNEKLG